MGLWSCLTKFKGKTQRDKTFKITMPQTKLEESHIFIFAAGPEANQWFLGDGTELVGRRDFREA